MTEWHGGTVLSSASLSKVMFPTGMRELSSPMAADDGMWAC